MSTSKAALAKKAAAVKAKAKQLAEDNHQARMALRLAEEAAELDRLPFPGLQLRDTPRPLPEVIPDLAPQPKRAWWKWFWD
jgi:hypothetical protein